MNSGTKPPQSTAPKERKIPRYVELVQIFREQIEQGHLTVGDRLPTFVEMRSRYGATPATVERVLSLLERDGLVERKPQNGIFVADPARVLAVGSARRGDKDHPVIGCFSPTADMGGQLPYWTHLLRGCQDAAAMADVELLLLNGLSTRGWERVDGVLAHGGANSQYLQERAQAYGVPFVATLDPHSSMSAVVADDADGIRQAVAHLVGLGHRKIAYLIHNENDVSVSSIRLGAYRAGLKLAGIRAQRRWVRNLILDADFITRGRRGMADWLADDWVQLGCTALLVQNDRAAVGVMDLLSSQGIRVPDDVSVIGFDSTDEAEMCTPRLTSVHVPLREIGEQAVNLLLEQIRHPKTPRRHIVFPLRLDLRASTAPPPKMAEPRSAMR